MRPTLRQVCANLFVLTLVVAATAAANAQILRASFTPLANFAYQLDCVAGVARFCAGAADYRALWKQSFGIDTTASPEVQRWAQLRRDFGAQMQSSSRDDSPIPGSNLDVNKRILIAAFAAKDLADYQSRLALLLPDTLSTEADAVTSVLYPPFLAWWQANGYTDGRATADSLMESIGTPAIQAHVRDVVKIFGSPAAAQTRATVHLMYRPGLTDTRGTSGENLGRESIAEFLSSGDPSRATPVILHEYAHFVFNCSDLAKATRMRSDIINAGGDAGSTAWALFGEAIATALGNGRVHRTLVTEQAFAEYVAKANSFYDVADIDAAAKAILPLVDSTVAAGGTVFDVSFTNGYVRALKEKLGDQLDTPAAFMREYTLIVDSDLGSGPEGGSPWVKQFRSRGRSLYVTRCCDGQFAQAVQKNARVGVTVIAVTPAHLAPLLALLDLPAADQSALIDAVKKPSTKAAVFVARDGIRPPLTVTVASDAATFERAAKAAAAMPTLKAGLTTVE